MTNEQGCIEDRLEKLELQNRRMKLAGLGTLLIAGAFVLMGQAGPRKPVGASAGKAPTTITATRFVLVDSQGRERAKLEMYKGAPGLTLYDENGKPLGKLGATSAGAGLDLYDKYGKRRTALTMLSDGPVLELYDANGKRRLALGTASHGPVLEMYDANEKRRAGLAVSLAGPAFYLYDANERAKATLDGSSDGPKLYLDDAQGFVADIGVTGLVTPVTGKIFNSSAASIVLFGKDKKVLWSAP